MRFRKPTVKELAEDELDISQKELLKAQSAVEAHQHYLEVAQSKVKTLRTRVTRLKAGLNPNELTDEEGL